MLSANVLGKGLDEGVSGVFRVMAGIDPAMMVAFVRSVHQANRCVTKTEHHFLTELIP